MREVRVLPPGDAGGRLGQQRHVVLARWASSAAASARAWVPP
ncbi:hypothetical protein [Nonomuraea jabiensis]